jgi:hypothetical protein
MCVFLVHTQDINDESMFEAMAPAEYGLDEFVERVEFLTGADDVTQVLRMMHR